MNSNNQQTNDGAEGSKKPLNGSTELKLMKPPKSKSKLRRSLTEKLYQAIAEGNIPQLQHFSAEDILNTKLTDVKHIICNRLPLINLALLVWMESVTSGS